MIATFPILGVAAALSILALVAVRLRRRPSGPAPLPAAVPAVDNWKPETVRVIYEQAREYEHTLLTCADAIDSKAATIYGVSSIVAGLASALGKPPTAGLPRVMWLGALALWGLTAFSCWMAFRTREYLVGPAPDIIFDKEWVQLDVDRLYVERLRQMVDVAKANRRTIVRKATALEWAIGLATAETLLLLVALWLASSAPATGSTPASRSSRAACTYWGASAMLESAAPARPWDPYQA